MRRKRWKRGKDEEGKMRWRFRPTGFFFYPAGRRKKDEVNLHKRAYASVSSRVRFLISFFISLFLHCPLHFLPSRCQIYVTSQYTMLLLKERHIPWGIFNLKVTQWKSLSKKKEHVSAAVAKKQLRESQRKAPACIALIGNGRKQPPKGTSYSFANAAGHTRSLKLLGCRQSMWPGRRWPSHDWSFSVRSHPPWTLIDSFC